LGIRSTEEITEINPSDDPEGSLRETNEADHADSTGEES
jgi:hypothetical protein